jgi:hypothetical protein
VEGDRSLNEVAAELDKKIKELEDKKES